MADTSWAFKISFSTITKSMNEIYIDKTKKKVLLSGNDDY